jgi:hypothetical protein
MKRHARSNEADAADDVRLDATGPPRKSMLDMAENIEFSVPGAEEILGITEIFFEPHAGAHRADRYAVAPAPRTTVGQAGTVECVAAEIIANEWSEEPVSTGRCRRYDQQEGSEGGEARHGNYSVTSRRARYQERTASFVAALAEKSIAPFLLPARRTGRAILRTRLSDGFHIKTCAGTNRDRIRETERPGSQTRLGWETAGSQARPPCAGGGESDGPCGRGEAPHRAASSSLSRS